ncbi:pilus assembly protein PilO [Candidatus Clostridium helianthi]|uniref:Pilus assembly protein PilO n=1 Tax=Candidatus Clostridium helianthi TaxID=3381660 RepID=A0ABW8S1T3_9CLOT
MKISKREKLMLLILGFFAIGILYYQFGYTALSKAVEEKTKAKNQVEEKYSKAMQTINSIELQKSKVKVLNAKITSEANPLYPTISQEHIILELDKLLKDSGLEGGMTFETVEVKGVESIKGSQKDKELPESSLQKDADEYNHKYGEEKDEKNNVNKEDNNKDSDSNNGTLTNSDNNVSNINNNSNSNSTKDKKQSDSNTVAQLKINLSFNGSYDAVIKFLNSLGEYNRKIPVSNISINEKSLEEVTGSLSMTIYSIPKIDEDIESYLKWNLNNTYGKSQPFNVGSAAGTGIKSNTDISDFMVGVKSSTSELPTVMIGKANDELRTTYAYGDGNSELSAEMILTKKDDKYYYKYKTNIDKIPINYNDLGNEFVPNSENIVLGISSESRVTSNDKSGLKLKIINNTDKLVQVDISGDDISDPRVSIDGDSKNISVNQK